MRKMFFLLTTIFALILGFPIYADSAAMPGDLLIDEACLLNENQEAGLEEQLQQISDRHAMDIVIVTVEQLQGQSPMDYADDFYDYNGYRDDGILLLISMEERDWWISTTGEGIYCFTDAGIDYISEAFLPFLSEGDYETAFITYAKLCDEFIQKAYDGNPYDYGNMPKEAFPWLRNIGIAVVIGFLISLVVVMMMKGKLKSVHRHDTAADYMRKNSLQITEHRDRLLYVHHSRQAKPKETSGGSSTHRSSSGRSHGGGGGKF